ALWNRDNTLPLGKLDKNSIAVATIGSPGDGIFAVTCRRYADVDTYTTTGAIAAPTLAEILQHDAVVAVVYSDNAAARNAWGQLTDAKSLTGVFMMNPYKMNKFKGALDKAEALLLCYDNIPEMRSAAAQAVFGGITVQGTLPVNIAPTAKAGAGVVIPKSRLGYTSPAAEGLSSSLTDSIDSIVGYAIATGAFPGCQVLVARGGNVVLEKAYGKLTAGGAPVTPYTLYDLASVSKATGTLPGVMKAYDLGLFSLDDAAARHIPGLQGTGKEDITVRQLLYHESGMPASLNMFNVMIDTASYSGKLITPRRDAQHTIKIQNGAWGHTSGRVRNDMSAVAAAT
ncbi:MAG: beta-lactamase family protein, partial [Muribaculaceae bacterium]|nr:beta-lactamase family protein [Muribaculaceae bacterium]